MSMRSPEPANGRGSMQAFVHGTRRATHDFRQGDAPRRIGACTMGGAVAHARGARSPYSQRKDESMHKHLLTPLALAVGAALAVPGCSNNAQNQASSAPATSVSAPAPAHTAPAPASTVAIPADQPIAFTLDDQYNPCNDFDQYVNSKWNTANPIPADQTRWGAFGILHEKSLLQQKQILATAANDAKNKSGS